MNSAMIERIVAEFEGWEAPNLDEAMGFGSVAHEVFHDLASWGKKQILIKDKE